MSDLSARTIEAALRHSRLGRPVYFFPVVGSTNDEALRLAEAGAPEGALVVADAQSAGRGRAGRGWHTPPGTALAFSVILRPGVGHLSRVALLGGLAAAEAIEAVAGLRATLKWPNDVWVNGRKVAGVLAESSLQEATVAHVVLGVGVNVNAGPPPDSTYEYPVTHLSAEAGRPLDRLALLASIVRRLGEWYAEIGSERVRQAWSARLQWRGERVAVGSLVGMAEGVDDDGALRIRLDSGEVRRAVAGDVHLRPVSRE